MTPIADKQVPLKEFLVTIIAENEKRYNERIDTLEKIINKGSQDAKDAVKTAIDAQEKAVSAALSAAKEAVLKAEVASEKRFDGIRLEMDRSFAAFNKITDSISREISGLRESRAGNEERSDGMKSIGVAIMSVFAVITSLGTLLVLILKK